MNQLIPPKILRVMFALPFLIFGFFHFLNADKMQGYVPSYFGSGIVWIYITGLAFILAAIALIINKYAKPAGYLLGLMLLVFIVTIHIPGVIRGDQMSMQAFLKDFALMSAAMFIADFSAK